MNEFSSVSVPAFDASSLTTALNERSAEGWTVVAIVPADGSVIAYLSRPTGSAGAASAPAASNATLSPEPASASPAPEAVVSPSVAPSAPTNPEPATTSTAAVPAVPSGWYADPSGRFELRYWDGDQWTEHVSRGGQQSTDPPVA